MSEGKQLPVLQPGRLPGQPPIFQRVGIVGLGLIGGSIALAARQIWPGGLVIGVDRKDVLERAMVLHAIDVAADDAVVLAEADLVILAAPIQQNLEILRELPDNVTGSAVVTDTGSTKRAVVEAAAALPDRFTFIGGHPLGGAARGGIEHARPDMFNGRPWLFTPTAGTRRTGAREVEVVCVRPRRRSADALARRSRSPARLHQPPPSVHRQRADARRR